MTITRLALFASVILGAVLSISSANLLPAPVANPLPGLVILSGTVTTAKPFKAAQVFARNTDKNILYMVYTSGGRYRAVNLFPGNYDVSVQKLGFTSEVKRIVVKANANATADFTLKESDPETVRKNLYSGAKSIKEDVQLASFDELYPPGPGREMLLNTCVYCHGPSYFPMLRRNEAGWNSAVNNMTSPNGTVGAIAGKDKISPENRAQLVAYLTRNFGPDSTKRALRLDIEIPLDEAALSNAMYVEYYLPLDPKLDADNPQRRGQDPHFDNNGNVWYTDRSIPNRIGKLDPRSGSMTDYVTPNPKGGLHGITVDKNGQVWFNETTGMNLGRFDPKTAEFTRYAVDSKKEIKEHAEGHTPVVDSQQNVWFTVINGTKLGKWDRKTEKITLWDPPTPNSFPYGIVVDKNDKIWFAEFTGCKVVKFDPATQKFTEYTPPTKPCLIRRLGIDSKGTVWFGEFSSGKVGKLDPATGNITEYSLPVPYGQPYDTWPDHQDNIWIGDGGQVGTLIKFDPRTEKFTYFPSPQRTDMPKLEITRENAIWYCPRSSDNGAVGVLYPDVKQITTMAAYY